MDAISVFFPIFTSFPLHIYILYTQKDTDILCNEAILAALIQLNTRKLSSEI